MRGATVSITNLQSMAVLPETPVDGNGLNVSTLKPGLYLVILNKDNKRTVKRFIKK